MPDPRELADQLAALRASYVADLPARLAGLCDGLRGPLQGHWERDCLETVHRQAHSLTGSGATFGFNKLSVMARKLETQLKETLNGAQPFDDAWRDQVRQTLGDVESVVREIVSGIEVSSNAAVSPLAVGPATTGHELLYLVEDDDVLAAELSSQLRHYGYTIRRFMNLATFDEALATELPSIILLDEMLPDGRGSEYMTSRRPPGARAVPVMLISANGDLDTRLAAARAGTSAFFTKPLDVSVLVDRIADIVRPEQTEPYRVVMVEDDKEVGAYQAAVLRAAGMQVDVVPDPLALMQHIGTGMTDLLLLDVHMPGCSGLELASVLRQQDGYAGIPIVFLSGERSEQHQRQALDIGGDDFLEKPVSPDRLVAVVKARARRGRIVRGLMTHDGLTGLLNHSAIKEAIDREVSMSQRARVPFTLALLDLDHFKKVNDTHGHQAGDRVLKSLSHLLTKRLRRSDLLGRYGGEEFIVALPNTDLENALRLLDVIRSDFSEIAHRSDTGAFTATFSAGVAAHITGQTAAELVKTADEALYEAKRSGRNRVMRAGP